MDYKFADVESIKKIKEEGFRTYENIDPDRLVLLTVNYLNTNGIEATFDNIVVAAFKSFPKTFQLIGFPEYPDAKRIHDCLWHCTYKSKGWLAGTAKSGFIVTNKGQYYVKETNSILEGKIKLKRINTTAPNRKELAFINKMKGSSAYLAYLKKEPELNLIVLLDALRLNANAKTEEINRVIQKYLEYAKKIDDSEAIDFLKFATEKIKNIKS